MSGISDLVKVKFPELSSEEIYSYITDINKSSNSIQNLLITLLDWAQTQTQNIAYLPEDLNLHELLIKNEALLEQQMKGKNIRFSLLVNPLHTVFADAQMIDTVLRNLLSNSIKFTPANGEITVASRENDDQIVLAFIDTGIGMNQEQATSLFDIQRQSITIGTAGETGTGLGLLIVKEFIGGQQRLHLCGKYAGSGNDFYRYSPKIKKYNDQIRKECRISFAAAGS